MASVTSQMRYQISLILKSLCAEGIRTTKWSEGLFFAELLTFHHGFNF